MLYHSSLFTGNQEVIKMYLTISDNFFIPGLIHYLVFINQRMSYMVSYLDNEKPTTRQLQTEN